jgi:hypothetical protein
MKREPLYKARSPLKERRQRNVPTVLVLGICLLGLILIGSSLGTGPRPAPAENFVPMEVERITPVPIQNRRELTEELRNSFICSFLADEQSGECQTDSGTQDLDEGMAEETQAYP